MHMYTKETNSITRLATLMLLLSTLCLLTLTSAYAQITPLGDSYTNTADSTTNYGAKTLLDVDGATQITYIQFNLASIPTGASVSQATLKLYVNAVTTAGSFNVDYVNGSWTESGIDASNAPALGSAIASNVAITTADKNQYILINVTSAVQAWLRGSETNNGLALVANSSFNATFDSKENTTTSHPAELDIVFAGDGTLTGVTTTSGSGLTGGGTSGTLNLSLTNACAANQVLQWNGSSWICAAVGTGTVTSVGSGTGLKGGPITGSGTLTADSSVVAFLGLENQFSASQNVVGSLSATNLSASGTVTGANVTATGTVSGREVSSADIVTSTNGFNLGANTFDYGSYANRDAYLGFAGPGTPAGSQNTASGVAALISNQTGNSNTAFGALALQSLSTGSSNTAVGFNTLAGTSGDGSGNGYGNTGIGYEALLQNGTGSYNTAIGVLALYGYGSANTAVGAGAGPPYSSTSIYNSTAIGAFASVTESNALVLGGITGINGCTTANNCASVSVGIGTTAPAATLDVRDNGNGNNTISAISASTSSSAVYGSNTATSGVAANGGYFITASPQASGIYAVNTASGGNDYAAYLQGNVYISGNLAKSTGSFQIDHPIDPANKYLYHSFVESPDMMNIYNGVATLDARGSVWVALPEYFEALNQDFRYQLTAIGKPGPNLYIAKKIEGNRFKISGGKPNAEVSWQVTGVRHDAYADAHRIQVEVEKPPQEQGRYLHPELFGAPAEQAIGYHAPPATKPSAQNETAHASSLKKTGASLK